MGGLPGVAPPYVSHTGARPQARPRKRGVEPVVCGHSTGLSPVAIIASATFWADFWMMDLMLRVRDAAAEILDDLSAYKDNATARSSE
jgi:hypothetical protein